MVDFQRAWLPYMYLYIVGGGIFLIGMYIILKSNSLNKERVRHRHWLHVLIFGLIYYMGIHSLFTFAAIGQTMVAMLIAMIMLAMTVHLVMTLFFKSDRAI